MGKTARGRGTLATGLVFKAGAVLSCLAGVGLQMASHKNGFMGSGSLFLYFTIQSNLAIAAVCFVFFVLGVVGRRAVPQGLYVLKYVFTVSILLTFTVFAVLLAPLMPASYLASPANICLHNLTPLMALADFLLCDTGFHGRKRHVLYGMLPPLGYAAAALALSRAGVRFNGDLVPYFFLNYKKLGWFKLGGEGIGVFYWILLMAALVAALGAVLLLLMSLRKRAINRKSQTEAY